MESNAVWMDKIKNEVIKDFKWAMLLEIFQIILDPTAEYIAGKLPTSVTLKLRKFATEHEGLSKIAGIMFRSVTAGVLSLPGLSSLDAETRTMLNDVLDDAARYLLREIGREVLHGSEGSHIHSEGEAGHADEFRWIVMEDGKVLVHTNGSCGVYDISFGVKMLKVSYVDAPAQTEAEDDGEDGNNRRRRQRNQPRRTKIVTEIDPPHGVFGHEQAERVASRTGGGYCEECRPQDLIRKIHAEHAKQAATLPPFEQFLKACDELEGDLEGALKEAFLEMYAWHLSAGNLPKVKAMVENWVAGGYPVNQRLVRAFYFPKGQVAA